jgi:hypothetical protein
MVVLTGSLTDASAPFLFFLPTRGGGGIGFFLGPTFNVSCTVSLFLVIVLAFWELVAHLKNILNTNRRRDIIWSNHLPLNQTTMRLQLHERAVMYAL